MGKAHNGKDELIRSIRLGCDWLTQIAQIKHAKLGDDPCQPTCTHSYDDWRGAMKGEYAQADRKWWMFCPIWHTGQAVSALAQASAVLGDEGLMDQARFSADFVLRQRIVDRSDEDYGLILAFEDFPEKVNTSAVMEALEGLLEVYRMTDDDAYLDASAAAVTWIARKAYMPDVRLVRDVYWPEGRQFVDMLPGIIGRPLVDDAVFLTIGELTNDESLKSIHYQILDRLLEDEDPPGNWIKYPPANAKAGHIHPRHAYWWGMPFIDGYLDSREDRYLEAAIRAGQWYVRAQRADGGLFRMTYRDDFNTTSFGHATSGIACACKLWTRLWQVTNDDRWLTPLVKGLRFCQAMQVVNATDENLRGVIIEKVLPPDGTDRPLIHIRDLGTIFFVQAACGVIAAGLADRLDDDSD